jgi:hypothetical protein
MWLYVPTISGSSPSAPAGEDSISESSWQFQVLARSCVARGKPSASRDWYRRWKKAGWLRRLSGTMCDPSTADHGVALWMASLAGSPARDTLSPANARDATIPEISGLQPVGSSSGPAPGLSSSKTSKEFSLPGRARFQAPNEYGETYDALVMRLRSDSLQRRKSARLTSDSAFSSSVWPTATQDSVSDRTGRYAQGGMPLTPAVSTWPTPLASDDGDKASPANKRGQLINAVRNWPTPLAADATRRFGSETNPSHSRIEDMVEKWPTPIARNGQENSRAGISTGNSHSGDSLVGSAAKWPRGLYLTDRAALWSTPRASDGEKGSPNQSFGAGGQPLASQAVAKWSTPTVGDVTGGHSSRSGDRSSEPLLNEQARSTTFTISVPRSASVMSPISATPAESAGLPDTPNAHPPPTTTPAESGSTWATPAIIMELAAPLCGKAHMDSSPQGQTTETHGQSSPVEPPDSSRRSLNPIFVGWLMNWPLGWASLASTPFGSLEMESYLSKQRTALGGLPLPPREGVAPRQGDLFS